MKKIKRVTPKETWILWNSYWEKLNAVSKEAADEFRDAVWHINGKWRGVGLGAIPADELIQYAEELMVKYKR